MCVKYLAECLTLNENSMLAPGSIGFFFFYLVRSFKIGAPPKITHRKYFTSSPETKRRQAALPGGHPGQPEKPQ